MRASEWCVTTPSKSTALKEQHDDRYLYLRRLLTAGLVDRMQVTIFPVITPVKPERTRSFMVTPTLTCS